MLTLHEDSVHVGLGRSAQAHAKDDVIKFSLNHPRRQELEISFRRTVRVTDNEDVTFLPPGFGNFQLYSVKDHKPNLPSYMIETGGFFMAMYRKQLSTRS